MRLGGTLARGGVPSATLATVRPLAAGSARRDFFLAPQAASSTPPHRLGPPVAGAASRRSGGAVRLSAAVRVHRTASHERSPPPRLRSDRRGRSPPFRSTQFTGDIPDSSPGYGRGVSPPINSPPRRRTGTRGPPSPRRREPAAR